MISIRRNLKLALSSLLSNGGVRSLDGLRTLAILLVVANHCAIEFKTANLGSPGILHFPLIQGGWIGVDLFLVLSGFLIGRQLLSEFLDTGTLEVKKFVLRRGLRIWPLYFFILALNVVMVSQVESISFSKLWPELFFLSNYFGEKFVRGSWSLSAEEAFYIIAPLAFYCLGKFRGKSNQATTDSILKALLAISTIPLLTRALTWRTYQTMGTATFENEILHIYMPLHTHFEGLVAGMVIAALSLRKRGHQNLSPYTVLLVTIGSGILLRCFDRVVFNYFSLALIFGGLLWNCLNHPQFWVSRLFSANIFRLTSRLSFGIYLWYRCTLSFLSHFVQKFGTAQNPNMIFCEFLLLVIAVNAGLSLLTYVIIEQPFIRWRNHLIRRGSLSSTACKSHQPRFAQKIPA